MAVEVYFNVLAKDLENAKEITRFAPERTLVGLTVKSFATDAECVLEVNRFQAEGVLASVGLGAGDPAMWKRVADVAAVCRPFHINQVYPAAGYTLGRLEEAGADRFIVNSLLEPAGEPGMVYITTGPVSSLNKEAISARAAARLLRDIGLPSVKFFPIQGTRRLDELKAMARAAADEGREIFEPTGGIDMENVHEIVRVCIDAGIKLVIPHLYTSLIDQATGNTRPEYLSQLASMTW
jgi:2-dehydro-3-deoxy-phosphogluconate aldolase